MKEITRIIDRCERDVDQRGSVGGGERRDAIMCLSDSYFRGKLMKRIVNR